MKPLKLLLYACNGLFNYYINHSRRLAMSGTPVWLYTTAVSGLSARSWPLASLVLYSPFSRKYTNPIMATMIMIRKTKATTPVKRLRYYRYGFVKVHEEVYGPKSLTGNCVALPMRKIYTLSCSKILVMRPYACQLKNSESIQIWKSNFYNCMDINNFSMFFWIMLLIKVVFVFL